ncbi:MAG: hypothetical protein H6871_00060 [Methylobacteriaceae bacterium]|nr:hypothetical protein [Methylobacteriaceae bacterium]
MKPREKWRADRERRGDPSDATPAVLAKQMEKGVALTAGGGSMRLESPQKFSTMR